MEKESSYDKCEEKDRKIILSFIYGNGQDNKGGTGYNERHY